MKRSPEAQALLERYRDALSPAPRTRERALAELALQIQRLERGDAPSSRRSGVRSRPTEPAGRISPASPRTTWGARWVSAALGGGLGMVAVVAWQLAARPAQHAPPRLITATTARDEPAPFFAPSPPTAAEPVASPPTATDANPPANTRSTVKSRRAPTNSAVPRRTAPAVNAPAEVTPRPDVRGVQPTAAKAVGAAEPRPAAPTLPPNAAQSGELERELRLLRAAYAALRAGHPDIALSRLTEHAMRFPHGELAESRDVAQIMALCQAGQAALARQHAEQFLRQRPSSANAARVRSLCAAP